MVKQALKTQLPRFALTNPSTSSIRELGMAWLDAAGCLVSVRWWVSRRLVCVSNRLGIPYRNYMLGLVSSRGTDIVGSIKRGSLQGYPASPEPLLLLVWRSWGSGVMEKTAWYYVNYFFGIARVRTTPALVESSPSPHIFCLHDQKLPQPSRHIFLCSLKYLLPPPQKKAIAIS